METCTALKCSPRQRFEAHEANGTNGSSSQGGNKDQEDPWEGGANKQDCHPQPRSIQAKDEKWRGLEAGNPFKISSCFLFINRSLLADLCLGRFDVHVKCKSCLDMCIFLIFILRLLIYYMCVNYLCTACRNIYMDCTLATVNTLTAPLDS